MARYLYLAATLLLAPMCIAAPASTLKKWQSAIITQAKKWRAAGEYAQTVYSHPAVPATAGTVGLIGAGKALYDAAEETDYVARKNLIIIGVTTLLSSLDAELQAVDNYFARYDKKGKGVCAEPRSRLTHLLLGLCRLVNVVAPLPALWSEYTQADGDAIIYGNENAKQEYVIKRVIPYMLPALVSATKGVRNLIRACRAPKKGPHQLRELSPTNASETR